ncbi:D-aminoacyl-tRNA deacylase [Candidatus Neomarinimicrobiota bacterium]
MIAVIQRVRQAKVTVEGQVVGSIDEGLVILLGVHLDDQENDLKFLVDKTVNLRIFSDDQGRMNRSLLDVGGQVLVISQFTLVGDWRKGRRPSFIEAARPELGEELYNKFIEMIGDHGLLTQSGTFGAMMDVELVNNGPVTFVLDSNR